MSGHSKFANIKHKKEKNDAAKGKIFTMIGREIAVAVKEGGPDPANNFKLAQVIAKAKSNNMPNDTIERGIKKAAGDGNSVNYETTTYEGYGPSGTAIIVKCLTDNKNRTAANVRNAFTKGQGSIGTQGCVSYMFDEKGQIIIDKEECDMDGDDLMMLALDAGAEDFSDEDGIRASELEAEFADMDGWNAESDAATLLNGLGIPTEDHYTQMADLPGAAKVKVLLAQALFGNPDILLLDEPTNHLDLDAIAWLEEFLINFENTVIVVSHDRYFLNKVCTNIADMDYGKIQLYAGNYDFWYESSQLLVRQMKEANKKKEEKIKELQEFISRFSANASKSKQATSRKRALEKIQLDDMRPSSRKYPYIDFRPNREIGNEVLMVENLSKTIDGVKVLDNISFTLGREDKVAFVGANEQAITTFFKIITGEMEPDEGNYKWGITTTQAYFPKDNTKEFDNDLTITDWLTQYSEIKDATYVRGFLGRMLFPGEDGVKRVRVLSGGEKVRCLLSKMMISGANILILDEPTNHLDMESITALNNGLIKFPGVILFTSHDHQFVQTTANRIIELLPGGFIDKITTYDEYLASDEMAMKRQVYTANLEDDVEPDGEE